jgi:hypothetical protein
MYESRQNNRSASMQNPILHELQKKNFSKKFLNIQKEINWGGFFVKINQN